MGEKRIRKSRLSIPKKTELREFLMEEILALRDLVKVEKKEDKKLTLERRAFREQKRKEAEALRKKLDGTDQLAFIVSFKGMPGYNWFTFAKDKNQANNRGHGQAKKYYFPDCTHAQSPLKLTNARARRVQELDKYAPAKKAPISELMKIGFSFTCSICHKHMLSYKDLENGLCTVLEGEGDAIDFASGNVICKECASKL